MKFNPEKHHRKSIRLPYYDYTSPGYYFITVCTNYLECLFGYITEGTMVLNEYGHLVQSVWQWLSNQYQYVNLDTFILMPNHFHGILVLSDHRRGDSRIAPTFKGKPLGRLVGVFKTVSTKHVNQVRNTPGERLWQRNYYEHIIRNEEELYRIREYIVNNPLKWEMDRNNPKNVKI